MVDPEEGVSLVVGSPNSMGLTRSIALNHYQPQPFQHSGDSVPVHRGSAQSMQHPFDDPTSLLRGIAHKALTLHQPEQVLTEIAAMVGQAFQADSCIIGLQFGGPTADLVASWSNLSQSSTFSSSLSDSYAVVKQAILATANAFVVTDVQSTDLVPNWPMPGLRSILGVATRSVGQVNGVISLMRSQPYSWQESEVEMLATVSQQVALSLAQLQLQHRVQKQAQYQTLFSQLTMAIRNALELHQILKLAVDGTAQALQVDRGLILRLKYWDPRQSNRLADRIPRARAVVECEWRRNLDPGYSWETSMAGGSFQEGETLSQASFWISDCALCQQAFTQPSGSLVLSTDSHSDLQQLPVAPIFNLQTMPALLMVPLESKNRILGFLVLQHSHPRMWDAEERELVELVGAQVSSAIIQTETLRQVESLVEERTAQLQQSLELQAKLYEITRRQIEKLREMNQRMDEFLSTLSHELRTPLTSMALAIRMLRQVDLPDDRRKRYLDILEQQCAQETSLINDLLALQELETKQVAMQLQRFDLRHLLHELAQLFSQKWQAKGLILDLNLPDHLFSLETDRDSLYRILLELLTNAGKYSDPNSLVRLDVHQIEGQVNITLSNIGPGIPEDELPYVFDKFRRCRGATQNVVPGTGLGLALVKSLVQHLNGAITASSQPLPQAQSCKICFTLTLPQILEGVR